MATLTFGNFPVDMTAPDLLTEYLDTELINVSFSSSSLTGFFDNGSTLLITGRFDLSSLENFTRNSYISGLIFTDGADDLIFSLTGLPRISFQEIIDLNANQIEALFSKAPLTINSGDFDDHLIVERATGINILNSGGGDDQLDGFRGIDRLNGGDGDDTLFGDAGNDLLNGGAGEDTLDGGAGSDTASYSGSAQAVSVNLVSGEVSGGDAEGDVLISIEHVNGSDHADELTAGSGSRLAGGAGDDSYNINHAAVMIIEGVNKGEDSVFTTLASYTLPDNVENLEVSGALEFVLIGNKLGNVLIGNAQSNVLLGQIGNDDLYGLGGNDVLNGGTGNDLLDGGFGVDVLNGGPGNDIYKTDRRDEVLTLVEGGGIDTLQSHVSVDITVSAGSIQIEHVTLAGAYARNITGNALNNTLTGNERVNRIEGNAGNDVLIGAGGTDYLNGGAGSDKFVLDAALGNGVDRLLDFTAGLDQIGLDEDIFTALSAGALPAGSFVAGTVALEADDFIIYNTATGGLFYDADGIGASAAVPIALLLGAPDLTASDITIIA